MRSTPFILFLICLVCACSSPKEKIPTPPASINTKNKLVIYQLMVRLFSNINTTNKPFGTLVQNGSGKMEDINDKALQGLKGLGATHIWFTGLIRHASTTDHSAAGILADDPDVVKGKAGSPYAINDYYDIDPDLAIDVKNRMLEFERLVERTHGQGLKVIIDFVPNHVARAYHSTARPEGIKDLGENDNVSVSFSPNNNFYYLPGQTFQVPKGINPLMNGDGVFNESPAKVTGNDQFTAAPGINEWYETVKLNYGIDVQNKKSYFDTIPDTWTKMKDILVFWAGKNVDGFRCDMAQMVPVEFWNWAIPQVKAANPGIIFIAEIYTPSVYRNYINEGRFDYLYDKVQLYDTLRLMINGQLSSTAIAGIQRSLSGINDKMLHFLENHDEQRIASPFFCTNPVNALPGMVVSATIDKGPVMIYSGQEVGEPGGGAEGFGGDDGRTTLFDYWGVPELQKWTNGKKYDGGLLSEDQKNLRAQYAALLTFARNSKAVALGDYFDLTANNVATANCSNRIVSYARVFNEERLIIIAGFNVKPEHIRIKLTPEAALTMNIQETNSIELRDLLNEAVILKLEGGQVETDIPPFGYFVLKVKE